MTQSDQTLVLEIDPTEEIDHSREHERELQTQARLPAVIAGFRSTREFQIAALEALVKKQTARTSRKAPRAA